MTERRDSTGKGKAPRPSLAERMASRLDGEAVGRGARPQRPSLAERMASRLERDQAQASAAATRRDRPPQAAEPDDTHAVRQPELAGAGAGADAPPPPPPKAEAPAYAPTEEAPPARRPLPLQIDMDLLQARGMITPRGERTRTAEEYRLVKRPMLQRAFDAYDHPAQRRNLIMVTSAIPGEGKTFTAINLAMSIAKERDLYVLLVDADLSRPGVSNALRVETGRGLTDLLEDESLTIPEVLYRTNIPNLSILPAGRPHDMGTELLASQRADHVISEMAERYGNRIIIFDTSPVLASAEGGALAQHVGQTLLVVEAERTSELEVKGALDILAPCEHVNLILNKTRTRLGTAHLGHYAGSY